MERVQRRLAAVLAADVIGYSRLIEVDEEGTRARLRKLHAELIEPRIVADGGRIFKTTGDGFLVEFTSAVVAVRSALDVQEAMRRLNAEVPEDSRIEFRIGINVGDVIVEGDDIHGDGVNVAASSLRSSAPFGRRIGAQHLGATLVRGKRRSPERREPLLACSTKPQPVDGRNSGKRLGSESSRGGPARFLR